MRTSTSKKGSHGVSCGDKQVYNTDAMTILEWERLSFIHMVGQVVVSPLLESVGGWLSNKLHVGISTPSVNLLAKRTTSSQKIKRE